jgi:hypothetical protein
MTAMSERRFVDRRAGQATLWVVALLVTVVLAGYQRRTGPTWPTSVKTTLAGQPVTGKFERTHAGPGGALITLEAPDREITGEVIWRRYPTDAPWTRQPMLRLGDGLAAELPHYPSSAKVEYEVRLTRGTERLNLPGTESVVLRYRGDVPVFVLLPHIMCMFLGLVIGLRAALGGVFGEENLQRHIPWLLVFMVPGGLVLGPLVQKYAFGALWTGWPVGEDLTDTKTLASVVGWVVAWGIVKSGPRLRRVSVLAAAALMIAVYLIPHSARGSQLDWSRLDATEATNPSTPNQAASPAEAAPAATRTP